MIAILALFAVSCNTDDVENRPVVIGIDAPVLTAPEEGNVYVLSPATMDVLAERFIWTAANFGEGVIPNYDVQIATEADTDFANPAIVGTTNGATQLAASHSVLNAALLTLGVTPYQSANFKVRIKAYVGNSVLYSNSAEMIITPYTTETPKLWVTGSYQTASGYGADWTPADAPQLKATAYGDTNFEGYVYFATDETADGDGVKFTSQADFNGTNYGIGSADGTLSTSGGNIPVAAGYYLVKANTAPGTLTYSFTGTDWGIVGFATTGTDDGWNNSTPMTYNPTDKAWEITMTLQAGAFKFRANNAWDINFGDTGADGALDAGGDNINVAAAGNYLVKLDLSNPRAYTYTITAQ